MKSVAEVLVWGRSDEEEMEGRRWRRGKKIQKERRRVSRVEREERMEAVRGVMWELLRRDASDAFELISL